MLALNNIQIYDYFYKTSNEDDEWNHTLLKVIHKYKKISNIQFGKSHLINLSINDIM